MLQTKQITEGMIEACAKVYSLSDSEGDVFYVGCTLYPMESRLRAHIGEAKFSHPYTNQRKNELIKSLNYKIVATILEIKTVTGRKIRHMRTGEVREMENKWIKKYVELGYKLTNKMPIQPVAKIPEPEFVGQTFTS